MLIACWPTFCKWINNKEATEVSKRNKFLNVQIRRACYTSYLGSYFILFQFNEYIFRSDYNAIQNNHLSFHVPRQPSFDMVLRRLVKLKLYNFKIVPEGNTSYAYPPPTITYSWEPAASPDCSNCYFQTFTIHDGPYVYKGYQYSGSADREYLDLCATRTIYEKATCELSTSGQRLCIFTAVLRTVV